MAGFGIQIGKRELMNSPVIGKIYCYGFSSSDNVISMDKKEDLEEYEVISLKDGPNGSKFYITNQWNDTFDDIQVVPEYCVKEFLKY